MTRRFDNHIPPHRRLFVADSWTWVYCVIYRLVCVVIAFFLIGWL